MTCGTGLTFSCAKCKTQLPAEAAFCFGCEQPVARQDPVQPRFTSPERYTPKHLAGKILTSKSALEGERKQVTVLFADLKGSMELLADRDPEEARKLLDPVLEYMMEAVHRYEGTVNQVMGDGIMALFGAPLAHEDHAVRACYAALRMQDAVKQYAEAVRRTEGVLVQVRVGLNAGEVVVRSIGSDRHMDYTAVGQTTHLAARMEQMAAPGSILLTAEGLRLAEGYVEVKPLGLMAIKGLSEPIDVYEVTGVGRSGRDSMPLSGGLVQPHWRQARRFVIDGRERLTSDPKVCGGQLCAKGTRVLVTVILDNLAEGLAREEILRSYPTLEPIHIDAALAYAGELAREESLLPLRPA